MHNVEQLTLEQELQLLGYLKNHMKELFLHSGSSRAVFTVNPDIQQILNLSLRVPCIVKMSLGLGGYRQSRLEYRTYLRAYEYGLLADIYARGSIFTVMEEINTEEDFYDLYESFEKDVDWYFDDYCLDVTDEHGELTQTYQNYCLAASVMHLLDEYLGETADNAQIGMSADGVYKAYDYGFDGDNFEVQTTRSSHYFAYSEEDTAYFFELLISTVEEALNDDRCDLNATDFEILENEYCDCCSNN